MSVLEISPIPIELLDHDTGQTEVKIDTEEALYFVKDALADFIITERMSDHPDNDKLEHAEELKNQIIDDVVKLHDTSDLELPRIYVVEEADLISDAIAAVHKRDEELLTPKTDSRYDWLYDPTVTRMSSSIPPHPDLDIQKPLFKD